MRVFRKCCQALVLVAASPLLLVGFGVCLAAVNLGDLLKEELCRTVNWDMCSRAR